MQSNNVILHPTCHVVIILAPLTISFDFVSQLLYHINGFLELGLSPYMVQACSTFLDLIKGSRLLRWRRLLGLHRCAWLHRAFKYPAPPPWPSDPARYSRLANESAARCSSSWVK